MHIWLKSSSSKWLKYVPSFRYEVVHTCICVQSLLCDMYVRCVQLAVIYNYVLVQLVYCIQRKQQQHSYINNWYPSFVLKCLEINICDTHFVFNPSFPLYFLSLPLSLSPSSLPLPLCLSLSVCLLSPSSPSLHSYLSLFLSIILSLWLFLSIYQSYNYHLQSSRQVKLKLSSWAIA